MPFCPALLSGLIVACVAIADVSTSSSSSALSVIYHGVSDYYVCYDGWTSAFSDAVCQQLGFPSASSTSSIDASSWYRRSLTVISSSIPAGSSVLQYLRPASCNSRRAVSVTCAAKVCGRRSSNIVNVGPYIINGQWAARGAWPWQVMLHYNGRFHGGGSLINDRWVLTAAHCVRGTTSNYRIRLGAISARDPDPDVVYADVSKIISYPDYTETYYRGDIALIQLSRPVTFTDTVLPICLPDSNVDFNQFKVCVDTGFGTTGFNNSVADRLLQVKMNIIPHNICSQRYFIDQKHHICIGSEPTAESGICYGDSGGPLACRDQQNTWTIMGVNSFGYGNCEQGVVARVPNYVDWIQQTIVSNP